MERGDRRASSTSCARRRCGEHREPPLAVPEPEFAVARRRGGRRTPRRRRCASTLRVTRATGREVHTIALTTQIQIEPARARLRRRRRASGSSISSASPSAGRRPTHELPLGQVDVLVPSFTGATTFELAVPCTLRPRARRRRSTSTRCPTARSPLAFHFTGTSSTAATTDRLQVTLVPWSCSARWRCRSRLAAADGAHYPGGGWVRLQRRHARRAAPPPHERGLPRSTPRGDLLDATRPSAR